MIFSSFDRVDIYEFECESSGALLEIKIINENLSLVFEITKDLNRIAIFEMKRCLLSFFSIVAPNFIEFSFFFNIIFL